MQSVDLLILQSNRQQPWPRWLPREEARSRCNAAVLKKVATYYITIQIVVPW
jgi:hypothetical protein